MKKIINLILQICLVATMLIQPTLVKAEDEIAINNTNFPDEKLRNFAKDKDTDNNGKLSVTEREKVINIAVSGYKIGNFKGIEYFNKATSLNATGHTATSIDLSKNTMLQIIHLSNPLAGYGISKIDVSMLPNLEVLAVHSNKLTEISVDMNKKLKTLRLGGNKISSIYLDKNLLLEELQAVNCGLNSLTLENNTKLTKLNVPDNNLTSLDVSKNHLLQELYFSNNKIKSINLENNPTLTRLFGSNNYLSDMAILDSTISKLQDSGFANQTNISVTLVKNSSTNQYESAEMNDSIFSSNTTFKGLTFNNSTKKFTALNKAVTSATFTNKVKGSETLKILGTIDFIYREDKTALKTELDNVDNTKSATAYTNASESSKAAYDSAISEAKAIFDKDNATEQEITDATTKLTAARLALDGDAIFNPSLIDSIVSVSGNPKLVYVTGESFDPSGLKVIVKDTKGNTKEVTYSEFESLGLTLVGVTDKQVLKCKDDNTTIKVQLKAQDPLELSEKLKVNKADKTLLQAKYDNKDSTHDSHIYFNAPKDARDKYDECISRANTILLDDDSTQEQVNSILDSLNKAYDNLNGTEVDKTPLVTKKAEAENIKQTALYLYASQDKKEAFNEALAKAKQVLDNPVASQDEVNDALYDLTNAFNALDGELESSSIQEEIDKEQSVKDSDKYKFADASKKQAYEDALENAKILLNDPTTTQEQLDDAKNALEKARNDLNGVAPSSPSQSNPAPAPIPQAPAGRTCQDDGYPAGYYWSDSAQACITDYVPTPKPVVTTPQNKPATTPKPTETPTPTPTPTSDTTNEANKKKLEDELSKEGSVLGSDAFKNASADAQKAYQDALSNAKEVLSNKNATQAQVDDALSKLNTATPKEQEKAVEVTPSQETPSSRDFSIANILFMIISSIIALLAASKANFKGISKAIVTLLAIASIAAVVLTTSFNTMTIFNGYSLALGAITAISAIVYLISNKQED